MKYRRKFLLAGLAAVSVSVSGVSDAARAADLGAPSRREAGDDVERAPAVWQGLYMGLTVGASGGGVDVEKFGKTDETDIDGSSLTVAPVVGYNFASGPWVWGVEADLNGVGFEDQKAIAGLGTLSAESNWYGSLRLRAGYAWDRLMIYTTAGLALADLEIKSSLGGKESLVETGFAAGLGAEYALDENWRVRGEGLVYSFSDDDVPLAGGEHDIAWGHASFRLGAMRRF